MVAADRREARAPATTWLAVGINAVAAFGLYLLFAGQVSRSELATAAVLAIAAGGWSAALHGSVDRRLEVDGEHLAPWWRSLTGLPLATVRTGGALVAALFGRSPGPSEATPFVHGPADAPADAGRRATAVLAASLAPDSFVVRLPEGENVALIHRIVPATKPSDPRWLA